MSSAQTLAFPQENLVGWERALYAFLVEKQRRSGSDRTVQGYSRMLQDFFGRVGRAPDKVTVQEVFIWAHGKGISGKDPSPVTIGARMACLSSFFRFLQRMDIVHVNPCDKLERPRTSTPPARGLSADEVRRLLAVIPDTPQGLRDRAIIITLVLTGRRRAEVLSMTAADLCFENGVCFYSYRGKGGKTSRREFPQPALDALRATLAAFGKDLGVMGPSESIWPADPPPCPLLLFPSGLRTPRTPSCLPRRGGKGKLASVAKMEIPVPTIAKSKMKKQAWLTCARDGGRLDLQHPSVEGSTRTKKGVNSP